MPAWQLWAGGVGHPLRTFHAPHRRTRTRCCTCALSGSSGTHWPPGGGCLSVGDASMLLAVLSAATARTGARQVRVTRPLLPGTRVQQGPLVADSARRDRSEVVDDCEAREGARRQYRRFEPPRHGKG